MDSKELKSNNEIASFLIDNGKDEKFLEKGPAEQWCFVRNSDAFKEGMNRHHPAAMEYARQLSAHLGETEQAAKDYYQQTICDEQIRKNVESLERDKAWKARGNEGVMTWPQAQWRFNK